MRAIAPPLPLSRRNAPKKNAHWGEEGKRTYGVWTSAALDATALYRLKPLVFLYAITATLHLIFSAVPYVLPPTTRTDPRQGAGAGRGQVDEHPPPTPRRLECASSVSYSCLP